jgi:hypothetical protein
VKYFYGQAAKKVALFPNQTECWNAQKFAALEGGLVESIPAINTSDHAGAA